MLAEGRERAAELARKCERTRHRLAVEKARLRRARGGPGPAPGGDLRERHAEHRQPRPRLRRLRGTRHPSDYLRAISEADSALAERVAQVRDAVHREAPAVADLKAEPVAYDERLDAARAEIAAVREAAQAAAARLESISASREASLAS